jgi:hypothetical protein
MNSKAFALNAADLAALGKNAALVGIAAGLTYVVQNITTVDLGTAGPLMVPIMVVGLDTVIKWLKDNTK